VDEEPGEPSQEAGEFQSAGQMRHAGVAANRGHGALVDVVEWLTLDLQATDVVDDAARDIAPGLHRRWREHGQLAIADARRGGVADAVRTRRARNSQPRIHLDACVPKARDR